MGKMKNFGTSETMQTLMRKSVCAMLCLLLLLSAVLPVKAAAETAPAKVVRVGSFEDTFNYCNEKGARKGYGYELLQTLSGYTGWQFEYVTCDWSDCFEKLKNGEIDIMGDISYTEDRAEEMLFSDEPMGEEKYYLYADLSRADISASDYKTLNGKKTGVLMGTEPEVMLTEWEEKHGLKTQHVNVSNNEDVEAKAGKSRDRLLCFTGRILLGRSWHLDHNPRGKIRHLLCAQQRPSGSQGRTGQCDARVGRSGSFLYGRSV